MTNQTLSTGQIARLFGVSPRTVAKWIDSGMLPGWRLPPARLGRPGERRVTWASVVAFADAYDLPLDTLLRLGAGSGERGARSGEDEDPDDDGPEPPPIAEAACYQRAA